MLADDTRRLPRGRSSWKITGWRWSFCTRCHLCCFSTFTKFHNCFQRFAVNMRFHLLRIVSQFVHSCFHIFCCSHVLFHELPLTFRDSCNKSKYSCDLGNRYWHLVQLLYKLLHVCWRSSGNSFLEIWSIPCQRDSLGKASWAVPPGESYGIL